MSFATQFTRSLCRTTPRRLAIARPALNTVARSAIATPKFIRAYSSSHDSESFEEFTARFEKEFEEAYDLFEVQRVLNNVFSYDLVPAPSVMEKALQAARRVNDYATASRVFEGLRYKVENKEQYQQYLDELKDTREELGITLKEELFNEEKE